MLQRLSRFGHQCVCEAQIVVCFCREEYVANLFPQLEHLLVVLSCLLRSAHVAVKYGDADASGGFFSAVLRRLRNFERSVVESQSFLKLSELPISRGLKREGMDLHDFFPSGPPHLQCFFMLRNRFLPRLRRALSLQSLALEVSSLCRYSLPVLCVCRTDCFNFHFVSPFWHIFGRTNFDAIRSRLLSD